MIQDKYTVADPGFPVGGRGPPTQVLFTENVCKSKRIWSHRGRAPGTPPRSANGITAGGVTICYCNRARQV